MSMKNNTITFNPNYVVTVKLLDLIKKISAQIAILNTRRFPQVILAQFERQAREISAFSSTSIEGNPLPLTEVKKILKNLPANVTNSEKEVINYNHALLMLNKMLAGKQRLVLKLPLILRIHQMVMVDLVPKYQIGAIRREPVFVNDPRTRQTIYWPPDHQDVSALIDSLLSYTDKNTGQIDPIILAGIFHKQFVIIHPFTDGNGRTVRLATKAFLTGMGLDTFNLFSFENYYNRNVSRYFQNVGVSGNYYELAKTVDYTGWLEYFAEGILDELYRITKELDVAVIEPASELKEYHKKILVYLEKHGFISDRDYAKLTNRARPTRALDFNKLIKLGYIERFGKGRATYYKLG